MNLKDAFRVQNKLQLVMNQAMDILEDHRNILKVKMTHLRSKVMGDAQDVVVEENAPSEYAGHANEIAEFLMAMMQEREKLSKAIRDAKGKLTLDMDSEVGLNRQRQALARVFRSMTTLRNSEKTIPGGGSGYRFNGDGNQVTYRCDARQVVTIDFNRNKIRALAASLGKKSDERSIELDKCLVNTELDYVPPFDLNDSFDAILTDFIEKTAESGSAEA
ncbi:hypothetical protein [Intestinimonas massiliensis (ex Afouda et al. 2020)]|uniref:hypothetical protein n=1 Tax=Intestinimonas massiliensis (ex Afouda et al. 2020) TaxID=1673721 RepID=UPI001030C727|nr:hypothetical protein [Intestinimonas massiliensis (ex Afouda et al. 2020)]